MKMIKMALLGGAALAVSAVAAQADDLTALKAQIESLNARVAAMEAAPSVPAGYSLMTMSEGQSIKDPFGNVKEDRGLTGQAHKISVLPTADAPAAAVIEWSGLVWAGVQYIDDEDGNGGDGDMNIFSRAQVNLKATNDTAVGQVGVDIRFRANVWGNAADGGALLDTKTAWVTPKAWGWWAMTPELTLGGGYAGSLGAVNQGYDAVCSCYGTDAADVAFNPGDAYQLALQWKSGPFGMGVAVEDVTGAAKRFGGTGDQLGVAGEVTYAGDMFSADLDGAWHAGGRADDSYQGALGLKFGLGDIASISAAGAIGQINNGQDFWGASALVSFNLSDEVHTELGVGYKDYGSGNKANPFGATVKNDTLGILGGIYYTPVSQLTLGLEGEYIDNGNSNLAGVKDAKDEVLVDFVSVWSF